MPGLDRLGRPVGYGDGRSPSLADKVRLLQQLVRERQAMPGGKKKPKSPVASINRPGRSVPRGGRRVDAPMRPVPLPSGRPPVDPGYLMDGRRPVYGGSVVPGGDRYR